MTTVKEKYGFLPTSVWNLDKGRFDDVLKDAGCSREARRSETTHFLPGLKMSSFNPELARRIIEYWSDEGDTILDPFAGRSTRMSVARLLNRNYIGYEIAPRTYGELFKEQDCQQSLTESGKIVLHNEDGCELASEAKESIDLIFTCPPYWDLEKYDSVEGQLSDCETYDEFLERITQCAENCYRVLKVGGFCIWVVSDFRKDGFRLLHADLINIFEGVGFVTWDIVINVLRSPFTFFKIVQNEKQNYTAKSHEYVLVFKKRLDIGDENEG